MPRTRERLIRMHMSRSDCKAMAHIIVPYLLFGGLWILLSDRLLERIEPDPARRVEWSIWKGWAYVLVTGVLLALLLYRVLRARERDTAALYETDRRFSLVFRKSPIAIAILRLRDGRFIDVNDSFVRLTGYSREEALGRTSVELDLWADPVERGEVLRRVREDGQVRAMEIRIRRRSGETVPMLYAVERIDIGGEPCLIGMAQDIAARKELEEELRSRLQRFLRASPAVLYVLRIEGERAEWVLAKLFAIDFSLPAFPLHAGRSVNHHDVFAQIQRTGEKQFDIYVFRSFARSFWKMRARCASMVRCDTPSSAAMRPRASPSSTRALPFSRTISGS